jgi:hypothetical protein
MISLSNLVNQFTAVADAYEEWLSTQSAVRPQNPEPLHHIASCTSDHLFSIAANLELTSNVKKALKVIRNLSSVAFTARLVMKVKSGHSAPKHGPSETLTFQAACISVPPTYDTLVNILPQDSRPRTKEETQILSAVMKTTRGLRQSFELAALVSPLIAIYPGREIQSQNYAVCSEELLLVSPPCPILKRVPTSSSELQSVGKLQALLSSSLGRSGLVRDPRYCERRANGL